MIVSESNSVFGKSFSNLLTVAKALTDLVSRDLLNFGVFQFLFLSAYVNSDLISLSRSSDESTVSSVPSSYWSVY